MGVLHALQADIPCFSNPQLVDPAIQVPLSTRLSAAQVCHRPPHTFTSCRSNVELNYEKPTASVEVRHLNDLLQNVAKFVEKGTHLVTCMSILEMHMCPLVYACVLSIAPVSLCIMGPRAMLVGANFQPCCSNEVVFYVRRSGVSRLRRYLAWGEAPTRP